MWIVVGSFAVIAAMRVIQKLCGKTASEHVQAGESYFRYAAYYHLMAALFALISCAVVGFYGLDFATFICSLLSAVFFAIDLFTGIEAMKGAPLTVCTMFGLGGLVISCVCGIFMFDEPVSYIQAAGLALFLIGAYFVTSKGKTQVKKISPRTYFMLFTNLVVNGLVMLAQKYFSVKVENGNVALFSFLTFLINSLIMFVCVAYYALKKRRNKVEEFDREKKAAEPTKFLGLSKTLLLCGALLAFAVFVINLLVTELGKTVDSVILFPVSSALTIVITAVIGWVVFKEKLTVKNCVGFIVGLVGIVLIGL